MSATPKYRHGGPVPDEEEGPTDEPETNASVVDRVPVVGGLLAGVGAVLSTYVIATATAFAAGKNLGSLRRAEVSPHALTEGAWAVLMNLGAQLHVDGTPVSSAGSSPFYWLFSFTADTQSSLLVFGILVAASYAVADCAGTDSTPERIVAGLLVVPAYIAFAVVFATLATWEVPESGRVYAVPIVDATLYAGVVFPTILALLGGTLAAGRREWLANRDPRRSSGR